MSLKKKYFCFFTFLKKQTWYWEKSWLFSIWNGAEIRPLEKGRKSPELGTCRTQILNARFMYQGKRSLAFEDFLKVFPIYGCGSHLGHVTVIDKVHLNKFIMFPTQGRWSHAQMQEFLSAEVQRGGGGGRGGPKFSRGVQLLIPMEAYRAYDFPGGGGVPYPLPPPLDPPMLHIHESKN